MKIIRYFFLFTLIVTGIKTEALQLSSQAKISVLTCSPGAELYSLFGHTAIRVCDPAKDTDIVFNYGTFDFQSDNFYIKYAQGLLPYQLVVTSYKNFINSYISDNRSVWSQTLNLDSLQRQRLFDLLVENYQPANRTYLYNFLFDNCSTRVRDIVAKSILQPIEWHLPDMHKSFWNLLDEYLYRMPWVKWGIHTILAQSGSREATPYQYMFLPDYLMQGLETATYGNKKLAEKQITLYQATESTVSSPWYTTPFFIFTLGTVLLIIGLIRFPSGKLLPATAFLLLIASGLIGCLLIFLGYFTEHPITTPNFNLIWANPLNLLAAFSLFRKKRSYLLQLYLTIYGIVLLIGIPLWFFLIPAVPMATLPLLLLLIYICTRLKQRKS